MPCNRFERTERTGFWILESTILKREKNRCCWGGMVKECNHFPCCREQQAVICGTLNAVIVWTTSRAEVQPWIHFRSNSLHCQSWSYALIPCPDFSALNWYLNYRHCERSCPTAKPLPSACIGLPWPPLKNKLMHRLPHCSSACKKHLNFYFVDRGSCRQTFAGVYSF